MTMTLELEVRLSYYDRVKGALPDPFKDVGILADVAPAPSFAYQGGELRAIKDDHSVI